MHQRLCRTDPVAPGSGCCRSIHSPEPAADRRAPFMVLPCSLRANSAFAGSIHTLSSAATRIIVSAYTPAPSENAGPRLWGNPQERPEPRAALPGPQPDKPAMRDRPPHSLRELALPPRQLPAQRPIDRQCELTKRGRRARRKPNRTALRVSNAWLHSSVRRHHAVRTPILPAASSAAIHRVQWGSDLELKSHEWCTAISWLHIHSCLNSASN